MHEIEKAIIFARKIGVDAIKIASARAYTGTDVIKPTKYNYEISKNYLPESGSKWSHYTSDLRRRALRKICDWLWKRIVINPDGSVSPCCAYYPQEYDFDNVFYKSIKDIWNSEKYILARKIARDPKMIKEPRIRFQLPKKKIPCAICIPLGNFADV
jgi:MoaA/NifB/PqqE/SkfB family radical SAM enzyme